MLRIFKDAGLTPKEAAELLHILSACVVGFGFASLWVRQIGGAREAAPASDGLEPTRPRDESGDLADYLEATRRWDPAQFTAAVDIVLGAYGGDSEG